MLARWAADGLYYQAEVLECDVKEKKVKIKYTDDTECWQHSKDLHMEIPSDKLADENIFCCLCDGALSKAPNEIIMCDSCNQGYHMKCHEPPIDREASKVDDENVEWLCQTCKAISKQSSQPISSVSTTRSTPTKTKKSQPSKTSAKKPATKKTPKVPKKPASRSSTPAPKIKLTKKRGKNTVNMEVDKAADEQVEATSQVPSAEATKSEQLEITQVDTDCTIIANSPNAQVENGAVQQKKANKGELAPKEIVDVVKTLAEKETNLTTDDFVGLVSTQTEDQVSQKQPKVTRKTTNAKAQRKVTKAAEAY